MQSASESAASALDALLQRAHALMDRRRYDLASDVLDEIRVRYPGNSACLYLSAFVDLVQQHYDASRGKIEELLSQDPKHPGARRLCAGLCMAGGELERAEGILSELLGEYPQDSDSYALYAELMLRKADFARAESLAREGLRYRSGHSGCLSAWAMTITRRSAGFGGTNQPLQCLITTHPESDQTLLALLSDLRSRRRHGDALLIATELLRRRPSSEAYLAIFHQLKLETHWTMSPVRLAGRLGMGGIIVLSWVGAVALYRLQDTLPKFVIAGIAATWGCALLFSLIWPSIATRIIR